MRARAREVWLTNMSILVTGNGTTDSLNIGAAKGSGAVYRIARIRFSTTTKIPIRVINSMERGYIGSFTGAAIIFKSSHEGIGKKFLPKNSFINIFFGGICNCSTRNRRCDCSDNFQVTSILKIYNFCARNHLGSGSICSSNTETEEETKCNDVSQILFHNTTLLYLD